MRLLVLSIITLMISAEAFAQRAPRGPRYNPPGGRNDRYNHRPDYRPDYRPGPVITGRVVINPRRAYRTGRIHRSYRRTPIIWSQPFGYSCNMYGDLALNGRPIHNFRYSMDCHEALTDIRVYGDYCDDNVMYDQSGYREADFASRYECRDALGWYY
jgi:hypothetical protein